MDNVEIEDFYHLDFTTATDWELFIANLEEIIRQWNLTDSKNGPPLEPGDFDNYFWDMKEQKINFADVSFYLCHYKLQLEEKTIDFNESNDETIQCHKDVLNTANDFCTFKHGPSEISSYYGIREFLILKYVQSNVNRNETKSKILISSCAIAVSNANCHIPALVEVCTEPVKIYQGISIGPTVRTHLDMIRLKNIPHDFHYLTGLLALFKEKVGKSVVKRDPVMVSVRFSYNLRCCPESYYYQPELGKLPFEVYAEFYELHLFTTWPKISENVIVDREDFTDLNPRLAPEWSVQIQWNGTLWSHLRDFLLHQFPRYAVRGNKGIATKPVAKNSRSPIFYFLFPDPEVNPDALYSDLTASSLDANQGRGIKTCPIDSLVWRLSICLANANSEKEFEGIWYEFVDEIMRRWERNILIPGVLSGFPNTVRTCLLHQKLQMINCCIERKIARESMAEEYKNSDDDSEESDDGIFYDCNDTPPDEEFETPPTTFEVFPKPEGRLSQHPSIKILRTGKPLYLPITQDPVPQTEDQFNKEEASEIQTRLMHVSLLSDMEAFKAANPGASFVDFIRWHSPKDFLENGEVDSWDQPAGYLSERMSVADNLWRTTWLKAKPVPVYRQKPLFDEKNESIRILHFLNTASMSNDVILLLAATLSHATLYNITQNSLLNISNSNIQSVFDELREATNSDVQSKYLYMKFAHIFATHANFWLTMLGFNKESQEYATFFGELIKSKKVEVPGGSTGCIGSCIGTLLETETHEIGSSKFQVSTKLERKEFILRIVTPRPSPNSTPQPQRLYARIDETDILLAGFFSEDTIFM